MPQAELTDVYRFVSSPSSRFPNLTYLENLVARSLAAVQPTQSPGLRSFTATSRAPLSAADDATFKPRGRPLMCQGVEDVLPADVPREWAGG